MHQKPFGDRASQETARRAYSALKPLAVGCGPPERERKGEGEGEYVAKGGKNMMVMDKG